MSDLLSHIDGEPVENLLSTLLLWRQRCRTDLLFLATKVLGYKDVEEPVHRPLADMLQKFPGGKDEIQGDGKIIYTPACSVWELTGPRNVMILYPRGHLKTTVITMTGAIQWIINFPDIRILLSTATGEQVRKLMTEISAHFKFNPTFRSLFPDFCPPDNKVADWGTQEHFTVPNRERKAMKEPTISSCTVGKVIAGGHYEVIIHSDLVDKENVKTSSQIQGVIDHVGYMNPLLERGAIAPYHGWQIVEGTPYDFSDYHNLVLKSEAARKENGEEPRWATLVQGAVLDAEKHTTLWETRFPWVELEHIRTDPSMGDYKFSCQYLCKPINPTGGLASPDQIKFIPRKTLGELMPGLRKHVTVDLHSMEAKDSNDFTVITLAGFDRNGRMYILDIKRGHYSPFEVIELIFKTHASYPDIYDFKIEKDAHARVLLPFLKREMSKRQKFPLVVAIPRSNQVSKKQRIKGLQPWFQEGLIRFAEDLDCKLDLIHEITSFSNTSREHDDILDTLADQMQNRDGDTIGDVIPIQQNGIVIPFKRPRARFMGFDPLTHRDSWSDEFGQPNAFYHDTGI